MTKTKKILFIDDEEVTLSVGALMLRGLGYEVTDVLSGQEGLELLKTNKFDLVLLDLMMPEIDGLEVLRRIRNNVNLKDLPVVIQTGIANTHDLETANTTGASAIITKPYTKDSLREMLAKVLCDNCV